MRVALVSLNQVWLDKESNFRRCFEFIEKAKLQGCDLVVFPEMTLTGFSLSIPKVVEKFAQSPTLMRFSKVSQHFQLDCVFGVCLSDGDGLDVRNALCVSSSSGEVSVVYSKIHLFSPSGEHEVIKPGERLGFFSTQGFRIGSTICYDLRFPEIYTAMAESCYVMLNIASWPAAREAHWATLLRARAIENQCFMLGVNRTGVDGSNIEYSKMSQLVAPDGTVERPEVSDCEVDIYEFDPLQSQRYRESFPTIKDRRSALYKDILTDRASSC